MNPTHSFRSSALIFTLLSALLLATRPVFAAETPAVPKASAPSPKAALPIRILAAGSQSHTDETGTIWLPAQGFADGETMDRPGLKIENTRTPSIYWSERFGLSKFTQKLPNGKYTVKLHFAVTYEAISGPGQVVFTVIVGERKIKDMDVWEKAGGGLRAYVESVPVTITNGELAISFISQSENPSISAIEIIPAS